MILTAICVLLIARLFILINNHSVNVLYWDQWEFYTPLFEQRSLREHFTYQYGPHYLGVGGILIKVVAELTGWNARVEAFVIGALTCLSCAAALWLRRRLLGPLTAPDVAIPMIMLTLCQYEIFLGASNPDYGVLPVLIMCYSIALTFKNCPASYAAIVILNLLMLFTGYGIFIGPMTIGISAVDCWHNRKQGWRLLLPLFTLIASVTTLAVFLASYDFNASKGNVAGGAAKWWQYPVFMALMFTRFVRPEVGPSGLLSYIAAVFGLLIFLMNIALFCHHGWLVIRDGLDRKWSVVISALTGYCLLFTLSAALGRTAMGLNVSQSSRYMSLMIAGFLGFYFHLRALERSRVKQAMLAAFLILLIPGHLPISLGADHPASYYSVNKRNWKDCYLQYEDVEKCDALPDLRADFEIGIGGAKWKLDYLRRNRINLYLDNK